MNASGKRRCLRGCRLHPLLMAAEILGTVAARNGPLPPAAEIRGPVAAPGIHCCLQGMPSARLQGKPHASIIHGRRCRLRGTCACHLHALWRAGAAVPSARPQGMPHASIIDGRRPPPARYQHRPRSMRLACIVAFGGCQWRGFGACRLHPSMRLPSSHRRMPLASVVSGSPCHFQGETSGQAACIHY